MRRLSDAGLRCAVLIAPVLPGLSDSDDQIRAVAKACLEAGAVSVTPVALHLRPGVREHYLDWLSRTRPELAELHAQRFRKGSYQPRAEQHRLSEIVRAGRRGLGTWLPEAPPQWARAERRPRGAGAARAPGERAAAPVLSAPGSGLVQLGDAKHGTWGLGAGIARCCSWANGEFLQPYHDAEWGVPVHDDRRHFEFLILESAQAGLSWVTILKRRHGYRNAFCGFDPEAVAGLGPADVERLLGDPGIIRNRRKVESAIGNARAFLDIRGEFGSFDSYIWGFVDGAPILNAWDDMSRIPAETPLSKKVSADLRRRGFTFLGPVVCYAHLQATGLVMDHVTSCFRWRDLKSGEA